MATVDYALDDVKDALRHALEIRMAQGSLLHFTQYTHHDFRPSWHHKITAREIDEWLVAKKAYNLLLTMPPRHGKSEFCSVRLPPYIFGRWPDAQILAASYGAEFIQGLSIKAKQTIISPEYGDIFPETTIASKGKRSDELAMSKADEWTIQGRRGHYFCAGIGGGFTGRGGEVGSNRAFGIVDDPVRNREDAESLTKREKQIEWWKSVFRTRFREPRILMLLTRWHTGDLAGWNIQNMENNAGADQWKVVNFPALFERTEFTHPEDKRSEGEALWPEFLNREQLEQMRANMDGYTWNSLYQQRPSPPGGNKIKRHWLQRIHRRDKPLNLQKVRFWDLAVTANTKADYTASGEMGLDEHGNIYIDYLCHEQVEWPAAQKMIKAYAVQEGIPVGITTTGMQKGFFQALLKEPELLNIAMYGYNEVKDKYSRAIPWIARAEAGKFYIINGPGVDNLVDELIVFTGKDDTHDDQVDWISGAYQMFVSSVDTDLQIVGEYQY